MPYTRAMNTLIVSALKASIPLLRHYQRSHFLCGAWEAAEVHGRVEDPNPMPGAGLTWMSRPATIWSESLDVYSADVNPDGSHREHRGYIVPDPACPKRFRRMVRYLDSAEVSHQLIEVLSDDKLLVIPEEPDYNRHILRRAKGLLLLN
jgi:hypothetical protein